MPRRPVGVAAIKKEQLAKAKFAAKQSELEEVQFSHVTSQVETFKKHLEDFAASHKNDIKKDAEFRGQFQQMCARIGVDPLASSKGFWAQALGVGDFYYELGVQIIEACLAARDRTGGLMSFEELQKRLLASSGRTRSDVTEDDLARAIKKLKVLGGGFAVLLIGGKRLVQCVPGELSMDHTTVIQKAEATGHITLSQVLKDLSWEPIRAQKVLDHLVFEGMAWVDNQDGETQYWFPGFFGDLK